METVYSFVDLSQEFTEKYLELFKFSDNLNFFRQCVPRGSSVCSSVCSVGFVIQFSCLRLAESHPSFLGSMFIIQWGGSNVHFVHLT